MTWDLVIFDCDGVLVDSEPIVNRAHAETIATLGYRVSESQLLERFCGVSDTQMIATLERDWDTSFPPDYAERIAARLSTDYRASLRAIPGVHRALDALTVPVCVASSSAPARIRLALTLTGLIDRFDANLFSAAQVARGKPAPYLFLFAAEAMRAAPKNCLVVEDSIAGVDAATDAGMTAVGFVGASHCSRDHTARLLARGAVAATGHMRDLPALITDLGYELPTDDGGR